MSINSLNTTLIVATIKGIKVAENKIRAHFYIIIATWIKSVKKIINISKQRKRLAIFCIRVKSDVGILLLSTRVYRMYLSFAPGDKKAFG